MSKSSIVKRLTARRRPIDSYPAALSPLLTMGEPEGDTDYQTLAAGLAGYVQDLIDMALDDDLHERASTDPAIWAPVHALAALTQLGAEEAAKPLLEVIDWDDDWMGDGLLDFYATIGAPGVPLLSQVLLDRQRPEHVRNRAAECLGRIGAGHATARQEVSEILTAFLDRPEADESAAEEEVTTFAIYALSEMGASEAYPAIKRAYEENRVDPTIIGLDDVEADFGLRAAPEAQRFPARREPGVRLSLCCTNCGRERPHIFDAVYIDAGTIRRNKTDRYDPVIIPERVTCPKCGAVDQYELGGMGNAAVTAALLADVVPDESFLPRADNLPQIIEFSALGRSMHPKEALEEYARRIRRQPNLSDLRVGYGNILRFLAYHAEARAEYERSIELDEFTPEPHISLAQMDWAAGHLASAREHWQQALAIIRELDMDESVRRELLAAGREELAAITAGRKAPKYQPPMLTAIPDQRISATGRQAPELARRVEMPARSEEKIGRNDPCPCGSGRKYKHCHGRQAR